MNIIDSIKHLFNKHNQNDYSLKYSVKKKHSGLGSGGNGVVKKALCKESGEFVALKCLNDSAKKDKEKRLRFEDEIHTMVQASSSLDGIIPLMDYSVDGCWYVMPIAEDLTKHCNSIDEIVGGIIQVAETLVELHKKGLSHRDIKPDNMLFYEDRWVLCDFGLVDIPDNPHNLTKSSSRIGAMKTIAPEMSRNPRSADGKKADVYSLAKSLWMMLTKNNDSFEGHYDVTDDSMSLHHYDGLRDEHLIEIDELLADATQNSPEDRPSMEQFVAKLKVWQTVNASAGKQQVSNWNFLKKYLFHGDGPQSCTWENPNEILRVLNLLSALPLYSHIFFPDKGWEELKRVEISTDPSCIDIHTAWFIFRVRLGKLHYESFHQPQWNYFLLEAEPVDPAVGVEVDEYTERVVEDNPRHYVSAVDAIYGVYNYDGGERLPAGSKVLIRCLKGKLLIVLKQGPYNHITQMDDGRHNNCSNDEFRNYVEELEKLFVLHGMIPEETRQTLFSQLIDGCSFKPQRDLPEPDVKLLKSDYQFVKENWTRFDFSKVVSEYSEMPVGKAKYRFVFHLVNGGDFLDLLLEKKERYLCKDGFIRELNPNAAEIFEATDREIAIEILKGLEKVVENYCDEKVCEFEQPYFTVSLLKTSTPNHLFSIEEIKKLMEEADDRKDNTLVIDEEGQAHILADYSEAKFYPVINETWCERRKYVGKYSDLSDLEPSYHYSLGKWRDYLRSGIGQPKDDYDSYYETEEELIKSINSLTPAS